MRLDEEPRKAGAATNNTLLPPSLLPPLLVAEIAFTTMLLTKASRFSFLFYARKSLVAWASNASSLHARREELLKRHVLQKFFMPWGLNAVASAHCSRTLKQKSVDSWVAVTLFDRRLKRLTARNTLRRQFELKYYVLSRLYKFINNRRIVIEFRFEALLRLVTRVFRSWRHLTEEFRHFHELMAYAARQHLKIQKRYFLERLVNLTNRKKMR